MKKNLKFRQSLSQLQSWIWIKISVDIRVPGKLCCDLRKKTNFRRLFKDAVCRIFPFYCLCFILVMRRIKLPCMVNLRGVRALCVRSPFADQRNILTSYYSVLLHSCYIK